MNKKVFVIEDWDKFIENLTSVGKTGDPFNVRDVVLVTLEKAMLDVTEFEGTLIKDFKKQDDSTKFINDIIILHQQAIPNKFNNITLVQVFVAKKEAPK